jgi:hypothetical protein
MSRGCIDKHFANTPSMKVLTVPYPPYRIFDRDRKFSDLKLHSAHLNQRSQGKDDFSIHNQSNKNLNLRWGVRGGASRPSVGGLGGRPPKSGFSPPKTNQSNGLDPPSAHNRAQPETDNPTFELVLKLNRAILTQTTTPHQSIMAN